MDDDFKKQLKLERLTEEYAYECYNTAVKLGQDVSEAGCVCAVFRAIKEYRLAIKNDDHIHAQFFSAATDYLSDKEIVAACSELFLGTAQDKLADVLITLSTCRYVFEAVDARGAFRASLSAVRSALPVDFDTYSAIELKMRYNKLKQDYQ